MEQNKRGGVRPGSGRKPTGDIKIPITIYVEQRLVYPFGTKENLKKQAYDFISKYREKGIELKADIKPVEPFREIPAPTPPVDPFEPATGLKTGQNDEWQDRILATNTVKELSAVMKEVKAALLTVKEKQILEAVAKEHSANMYTD